MANICGLLVLVMKYLTFEYCSNCCGLLVLCDGILDVRMLFSLLWTSGAVVLYDGILDVQMFKLSDHVIVKICVNHILVSLFAFFNLSAVCPLSH